MYPISIFRLNKQLDMDMHNIISSLLRIASYIREQLFRNKTEKNIPSITSIGYTAWSFISSIYECHMQVHLSGNNIPAVKLPLNHTSLSSTAATFLATCLMAVLQPSRYSVFYGGDTLVNVSTLKPLLGVIGVLPLKPRASPILSVRI